LSTAQSLFLLGRATHILTEWKHAGQSKTKAKKRKKKLQQKKARLAQATTEHAVDHKQVDSAMLMVHLSFVLEI